MKRESRRVIPAGFSILTLAEGDDILMIENIIEKEVLDMTVMELMTELEKALKEVSKDANVEAHIYNDKGEFLASRVVIRCFPYGEENMIGLAIMAKERSSMDEDGPSLVDILESAECRSTGSNGGSESENRGLGPRSKHEPFYSVSEIEK